MASVLPASDAPQRIILSGVSWSYYERTLEELADQGVRVTFLDGMMELISPLPKHERIKKAIADLIALLTLERGIPRKSYGATTFRIEAKSAGSEPDECFYLGEIGSVKQMEQFDPRLHRAPDLWLEVDLFSPSVAREPIYGRLGVPEVWRYANDRLFIRVLTEDGTSVDSDRSKVFPFLPMEKFGQFVSEMARGDESLVLREFVSWARSLPAA